MNYRQYREQHLPIGSGTVESACKNVVAARMKQSGMTWTLEGAKHMLQIRASLMSSRFARDFQHVPSSRSYRLPREPAIHSLGSHPTSLRGLTRSGRRSILRLRG